MKETLKVGMGTWGVKLLCWVQVLAPQLTAQLSAIASGRRQEMAQVPESPPPTWESQMEFLTPSFGFAQFWIM